MNKPNCPGHSGVCKFCKSEQGYERYIGGMKEVKRNGDGTTSPIVDECCRACEQNHKYAKAHYDPIIASRFGAKVPKGDEI